MKKFIPGPDDWNELANECERLREVVKQLSEANKTQLEAFIKRFEEQKGEIKQLTAEVEMRRTLTVKMQEEIERLMEENTTLQSWKEEAISTLFESGKAFGIATNEIERLKAELSETIFRYAKLADVQMKGLEEKIQDIVQLKAEKAEMVDLLRRCYENESLEHPIDYEIAAVLDKHKKGG